MRKMGEMRARHSRMLQESVCSAAKWGDVGGGNREKCTPWSQFWQFDWFPFLAPPTPQPPPPQVTVALRDGLGEAQGRTENKPGESLSNKYSIERVDNEALWVKRGSNPGACIYRSSHILVDSTLALQELCEICHGFAPSEIKGVSRYMLQFSLRRCHLESRLCLQWPEGRAKQDSQDDVLRRCQLWPQCCAYGVSAAQHLSSNLR